MNVTVVKKTEEEKQLEYGHTQGKLRNQALDDGLMSVRRLMHATVWSVQLQYTPNFYYRV